MDIYFDNGMDGMDDGSIELIHCGFKWIDCEACESGIQSDLPIAKYIKEVPPEILNGMGGGKTSILTAFRSQTHRSSRVMRFCTQQYQ